MNESTEKILVTGGAGYIGSAIVDFLVREGHSVVALDNLSAGQRDEVHPEATFVDVDITNQAALNQVFAEHNFGVVIHCAAKKVINDGENDPVTYYKNNVGGTLCVLSAMAEHSVPKIIFSSTAAVYAPDPEGKPATETSSTDAINVYGKSKLMAEALIADFARLDKISSYIIFRYFTAAGDVGLQYQESKEWQGIFSRIAEAAHGGEIFTIKGTDYETRDGTGVRDYIHIADLARAHQLALAESGSHLLNLGTGTGYSVREIISAFEEQTGTQLKVAEGEPRPGDVPVMLADASLAQEVLGWQAEKSITDIVESFIAAHNIEIK